MSEINESVPSFSARSIPEASNKRLFLAKVLENKASLFGRNSEFINHRTKEETWEQIRLQLVAEGATEFAAKTWKQLRDGVWATARTRTLSKLERSNKTNFTENEKLVLAILGLPSVEASPQDTTITNATITTEQQQQQCNDMMVDEMARQDIVNKLEASFDPTSTLASTISQLLNGTADTSLTAKRRKQQSDEQCVSHYQHYETSNCVRDASHNGNNDKNDCDNVETQLRLEQLRKLRLENRLLELEIWQKERMYGFSESSDRAPFFFGTKK